MVNSEFQYQMGISSGRRQKSVISASVVWMATAVQVRSRTSISVVLLDEKVDRGGVGRDDGHGDVHQTGGRHSPGGGELQTELGGKLGGVGGQPGPVNLAAGGHVEGDVDEGPLRVEELQSVSLVFDALQVLDLVVVLAEELPTLPTEGVPDLLATPFTEGVMRVRGVHVARLAVQTEVDQNGEGGRQQARGAVEVGALDQGIISSRGRSSTILLSSPATLHDRPQLGHIRPRDGVLGADGQRPPVGLYRQGVLPVQVVDGAQVGPAEEVARADGGRLSVVGLRLGRPAQFTEDVRGAEQQLKVPWKAGQSAAVQLQGVLQVAGVGVLKDDGTLIGVLHPTRECQRPSVQGVRLLSSISRGEQLCVGEVRRQVIPLHRQRLPEGPLSGLGVAQPPLHLTEDVQQRVEGGVVGGGTPQRLLQHCRRPLLVALIGEHSREVVEGADASRLMGANILQSGGVVEGGAASVDGLRLLPSPQSGEHCGQIEVSEGQSRAVGDGLLQKAEVVVDVGHVRSVAKGRSVGGLRLFDPSLRLEDVAEVAEC
ncbi:hypothetical protein TYRP_002511 [Tyrophagus putrescentiae]|nr:hypothetical protein TYRP_002511 [Tyrophagus putrescentiae]